VFHDTDGSFYGTFAQGGPKRGGGLFRQLPDGTFTVLYAFDQTNRAGGVTPLGGLVKGADGAFYGTTWEGGAHGTGAIFRWQGTSLTLLYSFSNTRPWGGLVAANDGFLYGVTILGNPCGTLFRFDPIAGTLTTLYEFACSGNNGRDPVGRPFFGSDGSIYGITQSGGAFGVGTIFKWSNSGLTTLHHFDGVEGSSPMSLTPGVDGALYGTTWVGFTRATLFKWSAGAYTTLHTFDRRNFNADYSPNVRQDADGALYGTIVSSSRDTFGSVYKWHNGTFSILHTFQGTDGSTPSEPLLLAANGRLYGSTDSGGPSTFHGTLFSLAKDGSQFNVANIATTAPLHPGGSIVRLADGTIYGTTANGGACQCGTLYKREPNGRLTTLHEFAPNDGIWPTGLVLGRDGRLYGSAQRGGPERAGTLFSWDGTSLQVLHSFQRATTGELPNGIVQDADGNLYGTTQKGGASNWGTLYKWNGSGVTVLHHFVWASGIEPVGTATIGADGTLYGVTSMSSSGSGGTIFKWDGQAMSILHSFDYQTDGRAVGDLIVDANGSLIGARMSGGAHGGGTLFKLTGTSYTVLHSFAGPEGRFPLGLARMPDGSIVASTLGGPGEDGVLFNAGSIVRWNAGVLSTLYTFDATQARGWFPSALMVGGDNNVYGSTYYGGAGGGTLFRLVLNAAPVITNVAGPMAPSAVNTAAALTVSYSDAEAAGHVCTFAWSDGAPNTTVPGAAGTCAASHVFAEAGVYTVSVTVTDPGGLSDTEASPFVVVYDPSAGFVTGNGRIQSRAGAYPADPSLEGAAQFAFVAKYHKGATVPRGETEFQFQAASFKFASAGYDWLVVAGAKAQFKGYGTVNGGGDYGFLLTVTDGQLPGGGGVDQFRIKIWDRASDAIVYDNVAGATDGLTGASPQTIVAGSIVIHAK
jgi:uncharacterized repeat protein (TIGR03803 family)